MTDPTEAHDFTFGCYRAAHTPSIEPPEDETSIADETEPTPVTDGGPTSATTCPACENELANVQGVPACTYCAWTAN